MAAAAECYCKSQRTRENFLLVFYGLISLLFPAFNYLFCTTGFCRSIVVVPYASCTFLVFALSIKNVVHTLLQFSYNTKLIFCLLCASVSLKNKMWLEHWEWKSNTNNCRILHAPLRFHGNSYATMWNNGITFMLCSEFFFWYAEYHKQMVCVCLLSYSNFSIICQTFMVSTFYVQIWMMMAWKKPQKGTKRKEAWVFTAMHQLFPLRTTI